MTTTPGTDPVVTVCFSVQIDGIDLGTFTSCDGLGIEVVLEQREEGGTNGFVWQLPTRLKFSNIKLSRALGKDSRKVAEWFTQVATGLGPGTASIVARGTDDRPVARWNLAGVVPVRWTGPSFNLDSPKIAMETIEIAHHGFTFAPES
ncbi:MAG: phage tail protein [Kineosporiaceae bacterium]|nr:phage tail protein [Kineosporiaceae bacterium]MBK7621710.1 phage tail protein [Kineosporiaceae bacterium]MBK8077635.1 phage tail protein [Kineosporiaceae bacterium]